MSTSVFALSVGVHAAVLAETGSVECVAWAKDEKTSCHEGCRKSDDNINNNHNNSSTECKQNKINKNLLLPKQQYINSHNKSSMELSMIDTRQSSTSAAVAPELEPVWADLVSRLRAESDVILFPSEQAIDAAIFPWSQFMVASTSNMTNNDNTTINTTNTSDVTNTTHSPPSSSSRRRKWRLVVLEASWQHAKTMMNKIVAFREHRGLPPLLCVQLNNITGELLCLCLCDYI